MPQKCKFSNLSDNQASRCNRNVVSSSLNEEMCRVCNEVQTSLIQIVQEAITVSGIKLVTDLTMVNRKDADIEWTCICGEECKSRMNRMIAKFKKDGKVLCRTCTVKETWEKKKDVPLKIVESQHRAVSNAKEEIDEVPVLSEKETVVTPEPVVDPKDTKVSKDICSIKDCSKPVNVGGLCFYCNRFYTSTYVKFKDLCDKNDCCIITPKHECVNGDSYVEVECKCGTVIYSKLKELIRSKRNGIIRCKSCSSKKSWTMETYQDVLNRFNSRGFTLLSTEYKNAKDYLDYKCPNGHVSKATYSNFKKGVGCRFCLQGTRILEYSDIKTFFDEKQIILLSTEEEINAIKHLKGGLNKYKISFECNGCERVVNSLFHNCKRECWIGKCTECIKDGERYDYTFVESFFEDNGCKLLSTEYKNINDKLDFECECGGFGQVTFKHFKNNNRRCRKCIPERYAKTCMEKYGVDNAFKSEEIKGKIKKTVQEKYGVDHVMQSTEIIQKAKDTNLEKYGYVYFFCDPIVKEKGREKCKEKYGVEFPLQSDEIKEKCKDTCIKKYGVDYHINSENMKQDMLKKYGSEYYMTSSDADSKRDLFKEKAMQTCIEKYGVPYAIQHPEIFSKQQKTAFSSKDYTFPSGNIVRIMGYEHFCLNQLLAVGIKDGVNGSTGPLSEEEIFVNTADIPIFKYEFDGKKRVYYPDAFVKCTRNGVDEQYVIEVKSEYTLKRDEEKNKAKWQAVKDQGYQFRLFVYRKCGSEVEECD